MSSIDIPRRVTSYPFSRSLMESALLSSALIYSFSGFLLISINSAVLFPEFRIAMSISTLPILFQQPSISEYVSSSAIFCLSRFSRMQLSYFSRSSTTADLSRSVFPAPHGVLSLCATPVI